MTDYAFVLIYHPAYEGRKFSLNANDYSSLVVYDGLPKPTQEELDSRYEETLVLFRWAAIRRERDALLVDSDWTQTGDAPISADSKQAWADYRQTLRDIPQTYASPDDVVWPEVL